MYFMKCCWLCHMYEKCIVFVMKGFILKQLRILYIKALHEARL